MKLFFPFALIFLSLQVIAQKPFLLRSTFGSSGYSNTINKGKNAIYFQQSVGQAGVTGNSITSGKLLKQGFVQPIFFSKKSKKTKAPLIYPNPVNQSLHLSFTEKITTEIQVKIFSIMGKLIFSQSFKAKPSIQIQLPDIPKGQYILHTNSETDHFVSQIIKN